MQDKISHWHVWHKLNLVQAALLAVNADPLEFETNILDKFTGFAFGWKKTRIVRGVGLRAISLDLITTQERRSKISPRW